MFNTDRAAVVFGDAWSLYNDAIEILDLGKPRIAAEAAWGATKRATDALILARTGQEPSGTGQTSTGLRLLSRQEPLLEALRTYFNDIVRTLHVKCFYSGNCEPAQTIAEAIRGTADYIRHSTSLAESQTGGTFDGY